MKTLYQKCVDDVVRELMIFGPSNAQAKAWWCELNLGIDKVKLFNDAKQKLEDL